MNSVSATGSGTANSTTGGDAFVTLAAADLPRGYYRIDVYSQMPTITNPSKSNNAELRAGADVLAVLITHIVAQNSGAYGPKQPLTVWRYLDGATALTLNYVADCAATETQDWTGTIVATPVSYGASA